MPKRQSDDFTKFAMGVFAIAGDRRAFKHFSESEITERITKLPAFKTAMMDPELRERLRAEFARWPKSRNLFITRSLVEQLHLEAQAKLANGEDLEDVDEEDVEIEEGEESEEDDSTQSITSGLNRYGESLSRRANIDAFRDWFLKLGKMGRLGDSLHAFAENTRLRIYAFRNAVKDYKDRADDFSYELWERGLDYLPPSPFKTVALIILWLLVKILAAAFFVFLIFTRPTIVLDRLGFDEDVLPPGIGD